MAIPSNTTILVTGGSGFLGAWCVATALNAGYTVRTTLRTPSREDEVRALVEAAGATAGDALSFATADLGTDDGWADAVAGCDAVLHVASPFPATAAERTDALLTGPARDGTVRVLRAARDAGVRRVVVTSSFGAIGYGHASSDHVFTEADWSDLGGDLDPYVRSKTIAERAAWDFAATEAGGLELAVVNPVGIFGPALGTDLSASLQLIAALMRGDLTGGGPSFSFAGVDVRDAANLHLLAMTHPAAPGERFLAAADVVTIADLATVLRERLGDRLPGLTAADTYAPVTELRRLDAGKARRVLGWTPRSTEDAVLATAESLLAQASSTARASSPSVSPHLVN